MARENMTCRICRIDITQEAGPRVVRVSGRLTGACVPGLLSVCVPVAMSVHVDLDQLVSADSAGLEALRQLRTSGAQLVNVPPFIGLLLGAGHATSLR